jgi:hypothetical protein
MTALAMRRSMLTLAQLRAGVDRDIDPHFLAEHARLFGGRAADRGFDGGAGNALRLLQQQALLRGR